MTRRNRSLTFLMVLAWAGNAVASDAPHELPGFFVAPITTDVHRALISDQATAYAVIDGSTLVAKGEANFAEFDAAAFERQLADLAKPGPSVLRLVLQYRSQQDHERGVRESIKRHLKGIAKAAGFRTTIATEVSTSVPWRDAYADVHVWEEADAPREPIVEDALVRVYPLRTKLSKMVLGDADCVVELKRPLDGRQQDFSQQLRMSIQRAVASLDLGQEKGSLQYRLSSTSAGEQLVVILFDPQLPPEIPANITSPALIALLEKEAAKYKPSQGLELAKSLGFHRITYAHTPGGGAPEKLVGNPVPDFTLATLAGEELQLRAFIENRPALVTFWGVACGPCCREAPHLTRMHQKHEAEFGIVAVNGYDESREVVAKYAEEAQLRHPIALNGGRIASELYFVGSYPTTFWIDREGIVEDYVIGFDSAAELQRRIRQILDRPRSAPQPSD